jgi:hypothetical protein
LDSVLWGICTEAQAHIHHSCGAVDAKRNSRDCRTAHFGYVSRCENEGISKRH